MKLSLPFLLASWKDEILNNHLTCLVEAPSGATPGTIDATISSNGSKLEITYTPTKHVIRPGTFFGKIKNGIYNTLYGSTHPKRIALNQAAHILPRRDGTVEMQLTIDLPFRVDRVFAQSENTVGTENVKVKGKMLYNMKDGTKLYVIEMLGASKTDFGSTQGNAEADVADDDDDDTGDGVGNGGES